MNPNLILLIKSKNEILSYRLSRPISIPNRCVWRCDNSARNPKEKKGKKEIIKNERAKWI